MADNTIKKILWYLALMVLYSAIFASGITSSTVIIAMSGIGTSAVISWLLGVFGGVMTLVYMERIRSLV